MRFRCLTWLYDRVIGPTTRERTVKAVIVAHARLGAGASALDVGAGTGTLAMMLKRSQPDATVVGIDGDPRILAIARRKSLSANTLVTWMEAMAQRLPFERNQFDCVIRFRNSLGQIAKHIRIAFDHAPIHPNLHAGLVGVGLKQWQHLIPIVGKTIAGATQS